MEFHLLPILALVSLAVAASHAALPSEVYWNSMLPNTPMPNAIKDLLRPDIVEDKSTSVSVGKGGVYVGTGKGKPGGGTTVGVRKGGGVSVGVGYKGKPVVVKVKPGKSSFNYLYAATETQLHENPNVALFFLEEDLQPGKKMNIHFIKDTNTATFLPRGIANSIPFSSKKLPEILNWLSIKPESSEAAIIKDTIEECEEPNAEGEDKYCATSLESMVDFSTEKLGKDVKVISTVVEKETQMQEYTITTSVKMPAGDEAVACHKQNYPYAVFYCHKTERTRLIMVPLMGGDGTKVEAVAVCHTDTSGWNPKHLAFQVLKVKPGTVPICHFLPEDHVIWVPK